MSDHNKQMRIFSVAVFVITLFIAVDTIAGQSSSSSSSSDQNNPPVGAFRVYPKSHFQCAGRPSGYYADVESGCQVYHMCDELGRQFSYSCPNTTLFQQRMLICDHWYMVNCSRAESNYAANLLIGQKDKPFVPEEEDIERTPRPDLLDRPYAPDYLGESFRNQYKANSYSQNSIYDDDYRKQADGKSASNSGSNQYNKFNGQYSVPGRWTLANVVESRSTTTEIPSFQHNQINSNTQQQRLVPQQQQQQQRVVQEQRTIGRRRQDSNSLDLGVSASQDSRRTEDETHFDNSLPSSDSASIRPQAQRLQSQTQISTPSNTLIPTSTPIPYTTTYAPNDSAGAVTSNSFEFLRTSTRSNLKFNHNHKESTKNDFNLLSTDIENQANADGSVSNDISSILLPPQQLSERPVQQLSNGTINVPNSDLLPPFESQKLYDDSTTQGPPIYYQWKMPINVLEEPNANKIVVLSKNALNSIVVPSDHLQPPKFPNESKSESLRKPKTPSRDLLPPPPAGNSPFTSTTFTLSTAATSNHPNIITKSPTQRSITTPSTTTTIVTSTVSPPSSLNHKSRQLAATQSKQLKDTNYYDLRKTLFIPDYTFPLESDGNRANYNPDTAVNSFQIKIPSNNGGDQSTNSPWYGENAQCPECHPSFLKPGSCEPCVKIR